MSAASQPVSLAQAPRCGARTRGGAACRSPAVGGGSGRCRMHGGKGSGAPRGNRNAFKHGVRSARFRAMARYVRASSRLLKDAAVLATLRALPPAALAVPAGATCENRAINPMQRDNVRPRAPRPGAEMRRPVESRLQPLAEVRPGQRPCGPSKNGNDRPGKTSEYNSLKESKKGVGPTAAVQLAPVRELSQAPAVLNRRRNDTRRSSMIDRRQGIALLGALVAFGGNALAAPRRAPPGQPFSWDWLRGRAAALAHGRPRPLPHPDPRAQAIDYDAANRIVFRPDRTIFGDGYGVQLFPLLKTAPIPVRVWIVEDGRAREIEHSEDMFEVTPGAGPSPHPVPGIAGFRVMNKGGVGDWLAFLGASYFRTAGAFDQYGLSARGLAIDTGLDGREEFPLFTSFWLERTGEGLTVYALLEGPSVVGAYRFVNRSRREGIVQDVSMALWLRKDVERLGIAPLTSMFWYDEGNPQARIDWRPEIHDSDGLLIHNSAGERIWRPLGNPPRPTVNSFADPKGTGAFGLLQRDRAFDHYQDDGVFYEKRPSLWVEPKGDWGPGAVMLYEIPTRREYEDNIVAFWTPARPARAGSSFAFDYRLRWIGGEPAPSPLARVIDRWTGTAGRPGTDPIPNARRLVVDFQGPALQGLGRGSGVTAAVTLDRGKLLSVDCYPVVGQAARWRLIVDSTRSAQPANLRATLERGGAALSETLIHQFN